MMQNNGALISTGELYINELVFYSREEISMLGFVHSNACFHETEIVIDRANLQLLLSMNKGRGVEILWQMENLFVYPHQVPATINLIDLFGTTQLLEADEIRLCPVAGPEELQEQENDMMLLYVEGIGRHTPATREIIF